MGDYLVVKKFRPGSSEWFLEEMIYREGQEDVLLKQGKIPGTDFVKISNESRVDGAKRQAAAFFEGRHKDNRVIEAWVQAAERRRNKL